MLPSKERSLTKSELEYTDMANKNSNKQIYVVLATTLLLTTGCTVNRKLASSTAEQITDGESIFAEQTLVDNENVLITLKRVNKGTFEYEWVTHITNKTDAPISIAFDGVALNNAVCDPGFVAKIPANEESDVVVKWDEETLEESGLTPAAIGKAVLTIRVKNAVDYSELYAEEMTVYPEGETDIEYITFNGGENAELVNNEQMIINVNGASESDDGYKLNLNVTNETDRELVLTAEDAMVNGVKCDPYWATSIPAYASNVETIEWLSDVLKLSDLESGDITTIAMKLVAYERNTENSELLFEKEVSINV